MRPQRLVMENFGSFRDRHTVDFADVDLFVLAGPTGAGKSTVIDAMTMALYGSVPRYDHQNLIEPAINRLSTEAKVSLTFTVSGRGYVVTRVLRRTRTGGGSAPEVRLEAFRADGATTTIASGSQEVGAAVVDLLGLTFDEFCKTVVLPQGAFAEFLHGGRRERQDLLVRLLGLGVYAEVGQAARARAEGYAGRVEAIDAQLAGLGGIDEHALTAARDRATRLHAARRHVVGELWPRLDELRERIAAAARAGDEASTTVAVLEEVRRPDGVEAIAERVRDADHRVEEARTAAERAEQAVADARHALADSPDPHPLERLLTLDTDLGGGLERLARLDDEVRGAEAAAEQAAADVAAAEAAARRAAAEAERLRRTDLAHTLAEGLEVGVDCPVCLRPLEAVPDHAPPAGLPQAEQAAAAAEERTRKLKTAATAAATAAAAVRARAGASRELTGEIRRRLSDAAGVCGLPLVDGRADRGSAEARLADRRRAETAHEAAERAAAAARTALDRAVAARRSLDGEAADAWAAFHAARDTVAGLGAPAVAEPGDVAAAWEALVGWAAARLQQAREGLAAAGEELAGARSAWEGAARLIRAAVADAGVDLPGDAAPQEALDRLAGAAAAAEAAAADVERRLGDARRLRAERADAEARRAVAGLLGRLLARDGFEQWLLNRLSTRLVTGASRILRQLTQGAFSLALDRQRGSFEVVDHLNADERRPARTLSGGETFLASLALALALADHVTQVSAAGASRLEALLLDEGFGTLDPEALETVAAAIEELSGKRMVGVVTHVKELAARIPTRFDVDRGPEGSTIRLAEPHDTSPLADLEAVG